MDGAHVRHLPRLHRVPARAPLPGSQPAPPRAARRRQRGGVGAGHGAGTRRRAPAQLRTGRRASRRGCAGSPPSSETPSCGSCSRSWPAGSWSSSCSCCSTVTSSSTTTTRAAPRTSSRTSSPASAPRWTRPIPVGLHQPQNYVGRILAAIFSCGVYTFFWLYNVMDDGNRHFIANWAWEDSLAQAVQGGQA